MAERQDFTMHASGAAFIPLWRAVAVAYERLFPELPESDPKLLDVVALALSSLVPIYQRDVRTGNLRELTDVQVFADGKPALDCLVVSLRQLERALDRLPVASLEGARASLTLRQSPRSRR